MTRGEHYAAVLPIVLRNYVLPRGFADGLRGIVTALRNAVTIVKRGQGTSEIASRHVATRKRERERRESSGCIRETIIILYEYDY